MPGGAARAENRPLSQFPTYGTRRAVFRSNSIARFAALAAQCATVLCVRSNTDHKPVLGPLAYAVDPSIAHVHDASDNCAVGNTPFHFMLVAALATMRNSFNLRK